MESIVTGPNDEWPILADPNADDEEWPLQPNIDPAPAPTEPTELRYQPHLPLPEPSTLFDKVRRVAFIMMISQLVPLVLTLFARIASPDEPGLTTVQIILAVGCALCFFVAYFDKLFLEGDN